MVTSPVTFVVYPSTPLAHTEALTASSAKSVAEEEVKLGETLTRARS